MARQPTGWHTSTYSGSGNACVGVAALPSGWHTSSYTGNSGNCVEVATLPGWRKSRRSGSGGQCVEVAELPTGAAVRDTKNRAAGHIAVDGLQWQAFLTAIKTGRFDD